MASGWFFSFVPDGIKRDNMIEWLLWALFGTRREGLLGRGDPGLPAEDGELARAQDRGGWDQTVRCMKVSLDPIDAVHRPLVWYFVSTRDAPVARASPTNVYNM